MTDTTANITLALQGILTAVADERQLKLAALDSITSLAIDAIAQERTGSAETLRERCKALLDAAHSELGDEGFEAAELLTALLGYEETDAEFS